MKICIIGTGKIANEVAGALKAEASEIEITGIFAHSNKSKAEKLAEEYGISRVYTDYEQLLKEDNADFIYLGIVNTAHYDYARKALLAGRNVIVEKPCTMSYKESEELAELAQANGLWLFEAVTTLHLPNFRIVKNLLPDIAPLRIIQCNYSQYSSRYDRYLKGDIAPAFNPEFGGGALNDLNIYNINAVVGLVGIPEDVHYYANRGFNGIDTSGILIMQYGDLTTVCTAAKDSSSPSAIIIQGENGTISIPTPPNEFSKVILTTKDGTREINANKYISRLVHEFKDFEEIWQNDDRKSMNDNLSTSLAVAKVLERSSK